MDKKNDELLAHIVLDGSDFWEKLWHHIFHNLSVLCAWRHIFLLRSAPVRIEPLVLLDVVACEDSSLGDAPITAI